MRDNERVREQRKDGGLQLARIKRLDVRRV